MIAMIAAGLTLGRAMETEIAIGTTGIATTRGKTATRTAITTKIMTGAS
jgi:hypothetical protein